MAQMATALQGSQDLPVTHVQPGPDSLLSQEGLQSLLDLGRKGPTGTRGLAMNTARGAKAIIQTRHPLALEAENSQREMEWLRRHRREYAGRWVAITGDVLVATCNSAADVYRAIAGRADVPLVTQLRPVDEEPFAGW